MDVKEFKSWFEGFQQALGLTDRDVPTKEQWDLIVKKISSLVVTVDWQKVYRDINDYPGINKQPYIRYGKDSSGQYHRNLEGSVVSTNGHYAGPSD